MLVKCRCGNIEIEIIKDPIAQFFCHCDDCQVVHGAAYVPESVYSSDSINVIKGKPASWTLKRNPRHFCQDCGTRLFIEVKAAKILGLNGYLLPREAFSPQYHMQCRFAIRPIIDGLRHYSSLAPQFGGPEDCVDW